MSVNGQVPEAVADAGVLHWRGRVLASTDLARSLNGQRELVLSPRTIITPLAAEELRSRGVTIRHQDAEEQPPSVCPWGYAQDWPHPLVSSALQSLQREGLSLRELPGKEGGSPWVWARAVAECVARGECRGGVVFCQDPGLVCCVANKVAGLRAAAVATIAQAARATLTLGPNLLALEMPGRTFFEIRQIIRTLCCPAATTCPDGIACTLKELDGHAHR
jgi:hypothetical protein